jgi:hypothetical protein
VYGRNILAELPRGRSICPGCLGKSGCSFCTRLHISMRFRGCFCTRARIYIRFRGCFCTRVLIYIRFEGFVYPNRMLDVSAVFVPGNE